MATYPPPSFYSGIFDSNAFSHGNDNAGLTEAEADLLYYQYPVGQPFQTLQQTDHTGLATFNAGIDINTGTLKFPDNTVQTTAAGSGGGETLAQTLLIGNTAGATSIDMNHNAISNALTVNTLTMNRGSSTVPSTNNINIGTSNMTSVASNGGNNTAIGLGCLNGLTALSEQNIAFGIYTLQATTGSYNLGIGSLCFTNLSSGSHNVAIGYQVNQNMTTGSYNVAIGDIAGSDGSGAGNIATSSTAIGRNAKWTASNQIVLGTASETVYMKGNADIDGTTLIGNTLTMNGTSGASRLINNCYYQIADNASPFATDKQMYSNGTNVVFDNDTQGGGYSFASEKSGGGQVVSLEITATGVSIPTGNGVSATSSLSVSDSVSSNKFNVSPNASGGAYNPATDAGNVLLYSSGTINAETLELSTHSATTTYVKVRPTSVGMGAGGTSNTATSSVECNGSSVLITPSLTFPDSSVQTTAFTGASPNLIPANNTWTGTNAFNNVAPITSTATQPALTDNTTKIPTTAWVQGAISGGGIQNPTNWVVATGNIQNNAHLNNASKQCRMYISTSIPFSISSALTARFKFEYSVYGTSAYNSSNSCSTAGTINLCANNVVNNPNTITYFDMIYGYNGGSSTQAVFRIANVQTTSTYWNTQQTYVPKNATASSYTFTPLSFTFTFSGTNPNHITFNIGFPQNPALMGSNPVGDMMCCSASLTIINSPTQYAYTGYSLDSIVSTNTAGSWYFA